MYLVSKILLLWRRCLTELAQSCTLQLSLRTFLRKKKNLYIRDLFTRILSFFSCLLLFQCLSMKPRKLKEQIFFFFSFGKTWKVLCGCFVVCFFHYGAVSDLRF